VVVDEAHHLCARTFSKSMAMFPGRFRLGLTATPDRRDGLGFALHYFLGPTVFRVTRAYADVDVQIVRYDGGDHREIIIGGRPAYTQMVTRLVKDSRRTERVAREITALVDAGRRIIVMSDRLNHLDALMALVQARRPGVRCGKYVGETTKRGKRKRGEVQEEARVIFSTYRMGEEGLDIASLDALVLASPKRAVEQTVGRIMRAHPDKQRPLVVDILDPFSLFWGMHRARRRFYAESGFTTREPGKKK
jgi:superfamily II DNA or RNA helicase